MLILSNGARQWRGFAASIDDGAWDTQQLGGWGRPDEWDPLVSGPVRGEGCGLLLGCGCCAREREGKERRWAAAQLCIFFVTTKFLVLQIT